jgi:DNA gyrase, A subunit
MSLRFTGTDAALRPMGRPSSGVMGMKFRGDDSLLTMDVVRDNSEVFVVTEGGFAKRTSVAEYRVQGRAGLGVKVAKLTAERGDLVGALITEGEDVLVIMASGKVMRASVDEVSRTGRNTQGVTFARPDDGDRIIAIARNVESTLDKKGIGQESAPVGAESRVDAASAGGQPPRGESGLREDAAGFDTVAFDVADAAEGASDDEVTE